MSSLVEPQVEKSHEGIEKYNQQKENESLDNIKEKLDEDDEDVTYWRRVTFEPRRFTCSSSAMAAGMKVKPPTTNIGVIVEPPHDTISGPPWRTRKTPHGGYAAFATRDIRAGEIICTEFPAVWHPAHHPYTAADLVTLQSRVDALDAEDSAAFFAMANVVPTSESQTVTSDYNTGEHGGLPPAAGIFMTNSFDMTESPFGDSCSAMYLALGRLNHSCVPNIQQTHNPTTTEEIVVAVRDIACGEELNDCYIDLRQDTASRRKLLKENYGFLCLCAACSRMDNVETESQAVADDALRKEVGTIGEEVLTSVVGANRSDLLIILNRLTDLVHRLERNPEALKWAVRYLAELQMMISQVASALGDMEQAKRAASFANRLNIHLQSDQSPDSQRSAKALKAIKKKKK